MDKNEDLLKLLLQKQEEPQDIKEFIGKLLYYWKWFVLAAIVGLGLALTVTRMTQPTYKAQALLLVKEGESDKLSLDNLFSASPLSKDVKIENHIGILTSFSLNYQVIENLGWNISWFREMPLKDYKLFGNEPYKVEFKPDAFNLKNVPIHITPIDEQHYRLEVDAKTKILKVETEVVIDKELEFGKPFENQYFSFTLQKAITPEDGDYYFVFNDLEAMTLANLKKLEVTSVNKNADLITMNFSGNSPEQEINYLNELAQVFIQYGLKQKNQIAENTIQFIDHQLKEIVDTLKSTSNQFTQFRSNKKVFDLGQEASLVSGKLSELDNKRSMAKMQLEYYQNLRSYMSQNGNMKNIVFPSVVGITDEGLNAMVVKLSELNSKKEALSYSVHSKNPSVQMIDKELDYIRKSLEENVNNLVFNTTNELKSIEQEIKEVNVQLSSYPKTEQELINMKRMVDLNNELYNFLLQKRAESQITKASNIPDVDILDPAREATMEQTGPRGKINLLIGLILGLGIPFVILVVRDFLDETVHDKDQLEKLTKLPIIAEVMHSDFAEPLPVVPYPRSVLSESIRELRTSLEYLIFEDQKPVVGIHSMIPGEGKTFVSSNLAAMVAMNNLKVVLVGADMRKPTMHQYFGMQKEPGLSTYLIGHHSIDEIIRPSGIENLDIIAAGVVPPNPVELLGSPAFERLLSTLKERYDMILIDNSPVTLVTDAAVVARYTTANLFVFRQKFSPRKLVESLEQITIKNKMQKTGIVLNDINPKKYGGYGYRYGAYYRKSYYGAGGGYFDDAKKG